MKILVVLLLGSFYGTVSARDATPNTLQTTIDVSHYEIDIRITPERSYIEGTAVVRFMAEEDSLSVPFQVNDNITIIQVVDEEGVVLDQSYDNYDSTGVLVRGIDPFKSGETYTLKFSFDGILEKEQYGFLEDVPTSQTDFIDASGAYLLTEGKWFPQHMLPVDEAIFSIKVRVPLGFSVVSAGDLQGIELIGMGEQFHWESDQAIGHCPVLVGRYYRAQYDIQPVAATLYASEDFSGNLEDIVAQISDGLGFFSEEFGPFRAERLNMVDVGNVRFATTGSEGLILLEEKLLQSKTSTLMTLAKRLADQWWVYPTLILGDHDAWLRDAFANYAALRYLEEKHSELFEKELAKLLIEALKYEEQAPVTKGYLLGPGSTEYNAIVAAKGAMVLYMLRQLIEPQVFNEYFREWYRIHASIEEVSTQDFVDFINRKTGENYNWFFLQWLESTGVPEFRVDYTVFKISSGGFRIRGSIEQDMELFKMPAEILIDTKGESEEKELYLRGRSTPFNFLVATRPQHLVVDPKGKILRRSAALEVAVKVALGDDYRDADEFISAIREYEKAKSLDPRSSLAHYRLGQIYFEQNSYTNAADSLRDSLNGDLEPHWVEAMAQLHLGKIYDILGERNRALAEYRKVLNSKVTYQGADEEAKRLTEQPYSRPKSLIN